MWKAAQSKKIWSITLINHPFLKLFRSCWNLKWSYLSGVRSHDALWLLSRPMATFLALHRLPEGTRSKWAVKLQRATKMANPDSRLWMPRGKQTHTSHLLLWDANWNFGHLQKPAKSGNPWFHTLHAEVNCLFLVRWGRHLEFPAVRPANQRLRMCLCLKVSLFVHFCTMNTDPTSKKVGFSSEQCVKQNKHIWAMWRETMYVLFFRVWATDIFCMRLNDSFKTAALLLRTFFRIHNGLNSSGWWKRLPDWKMLEIAGTFNWSNNLKCVSYCIMGILIRIPVLDCPISP